MQSVRVCVRVRVCVAELGDYDAVEHNASSSSADYVARCKLLPKQADDGQHRAVADLHMRLMSVTLCIANVCLVTLITDATQQQQEQPLHG